MFIYVTLSIRSIGYSIISSGNSGWDDKSNEKYLNRYNHIHIYLIIYCDIMTVRCKIRPSGHAKTKMISYGFETDIVLEYILKGAKRIEEDKIIASYKGIEIVYKQRPCNYSIITVYWKT